MADKFPYENLNNEEFENLVIRITKELLGEGCKTFSLGRDGAKDSLGETHPVIVEMLKNKLSIDKAEIVGR